MKHQQKIFILIIVIFLLSSISNAQYIGKRWAVVEDFEDITVYLDTSSIRSLDDQLAIWSLTIYRVPQKVEPLTKMVSHIKSQYLINIPAKQYSVIGALYYDAQGRIIGEASNPRMLGENEPYSKPIDENPSLQILINKAWAFISTGKLDGIPDEDIISLDRVAFNLSLNQKISERLNKNNEEYSNLSGGTESGDSSKTNEDSSIQTDLSMLTPNTTPNIDLLQESSQDDTSTQTPTTEPILSPEENDTAEYDSSNESNVASTIFTDGSLFCFQVSSWKRKKIADSEVQRLRDLGHNAFVVEAYIPSKGGTWYRVRIGYFNSLQEARNYKNRM
ncbi:SPOR domain-containing protein [Bacteroidota bacterium]